MDSTTYDSTLPDNNLNSQCLVCGSHSLANYVDLSLKTSRTSQSDTLIKSKLNHIFLDSWVSSDNEVVLCLPCFHLVDQFDVLEMQLDTIRKELTEKYISRTGFRSKARDQQPKLVTAKKKRKRKPYIKKKKQSSDDLNNYLPPDNILLNQALEHSFNANSDAQEIHSVGSELVWSQDSVQLQTLGNVTATNSVWNKSEAVQTATTQSCSQGQIVCVDNLDAIRKELTEKCVSRTGFRSKARDQQPKLVTANKVQTGKVKKKRKPYIKKKKQSSDDLNNYLPPDNILLNQELEHSLNANSDAQEIHNVGSELVWSQDSVLLQTLGDVTATNSVWNKSEAVQSATTQSCSQGQIVCADNNPPTVYDNDPNFLNSGERLRIGVETSENNVMSFACVYCSLTIPNIESLKSHVHMQHLPKVLTSPIPVELGIGNTMNCGVQLENVSYAFLDSVKPFACIFCDASFKFKSNLSLHFKEKHTPHKPFSCVECLESFRRSMELSRHKVYYCPRRKMNLPRKDKKTK